MALALSHSTELWLDRVRTKRLVSQLLARQGDQTQERCLFRESAANAAVDVVIRTRFMPRWWPEETKGYVIRQLRLGINPRMLSRMTRLDQVILERVARATRSNSVTELLRNEGLLLAA